MCVAVMWPGKVFVRCLEVCCPLSHSARKPLEACSWPQRIGISYNLLLGPVSKEAGVEDGRGVSMRVASVT